MFDSKFCQYRCICLVGILWQPLINERTLNYHRNGVTFRRKTTISFPFHFFKLERTEFGEFDEQPPPLAHPFSLLFRLSLGLVFGLKNVAIGLLAARPPTVFMDSNPIHTAIVSNEPGHTEQHFGQIAGHFPLSILRLSSCLDIEPEASFEFLVSRISLSLSPSLCISRHPMLAILCH